MADSYRLIWYRTDLRVHDHEPMAQALEVRSHPIPVYCFDPRQFGHTAYGFPKTGAIRAQFLLESVADLRQCLRRLGSDLIVRWGHPETVLPQLAAQCGATAITYHQEVTAEEQAVEAALRQALPPSVQLHSVWGHTLYHPDDLPFALSDLPELFTSFRKQVEKASTVNPAYPTPQSLPPLPEGLEPGELPQLHDLGLERPTTCDRVVLSFQGGETAGLARLQQYVWDADRLRVYKETRNGMLRADDSSKLSPWLALGCLSPRLIYEQVQQYEAQRVRNDSTYWLVFELLWRDYFRFIAAKHGAKLFRPSGLQGIPLPWKEDWNLFERWRQGTTGFPLVDANMRELAATGFMSNRGRQNVASFLTKNLGLNWQMGAEWFESQLIDYDVCSNYGNWNYTAGVGNDARGFRFFNIVKQSKDYDPQGEYVKYWLPELAQVPAAKVHEPWRLLPVEQERFGVQLGTDYPQPLVDLFRSAADNEAIYNAALRRHGAKGLPGTQSRATTKSRRR